MPTPFEKISPIFKFLRCFSLLLTLAGAPLYLLRWHYGFLPTTLLEHLIAATFIISVAEKLISFSKRKKLSFSLPPRPLLLLIFFFLLTATIALLITPDLRGGAGVWKAYFIEPWLFFFLLFDALKEKIVRPRQLALAYLISAVFLALWGLLQTKGILIITAAEGALQRAHGPFNSANALALFLGPLLPLVLTRPFFLAHDRLKRSFIFFLLWSGLFATRSRGGIIASASVLFFLLLFPHLKEKLKKIKSALWWIGVVSFLFLQLIVLNWAAAQAPEVDNPWQRRGGTLSIRLCLWQGTLDLLRDHPLSGAGLSGFKELYRDFYHTCDAEPLEYPHNLILNFWTELGLGGLLSFLAIFFLTLRSIITLDPGLAGAFLYWLVHGLVDVPYFKNDLALIFTALTAWAWVIAAADRQH